MEYTVEVPPSVLHKKYPEDIPKPNLDAPSTKTIWAVLSITFAQKA